MHVHEAEKTWRTWWLVLCLATCVFPLSALAEPSLQNAASNSTHWAFRRPVSHPIPSVRQDAWPRMPIDNFVLRRLEERGLPPSPAADRRTLIRRATYGLTGLPPTMTDVEAFEADAAPDAFARVVDRLLASPRYGERWGRYWLDVARYADTKGYVYYYEESRFVQPHNYRDWVIHAFNVDLPYDRFVLLQIAADQVVSRQSAETGRASAAVSTLRWPAPVYEADVAALGFLTLGRRFLGLAPDIIDDQIDVVMRGTQALTVGCARCHDHKFDPIPTRDYYSLYGVFQSSEERIVATEPPPGPQQLMPFSQAKAYLTFEQGLTERLRKLETKFQSASEDVANRLRGRVTDYVLAVLDVAKLPSDANVRPQPEDINPFNVRQWEGYLAAHADPRDPIFGPWHAFNRLASEDGPERARALAQRFAANTERSLNPRVAGLFTNSPASMQELAARYGGLLGGIHRAWQTNLATNTKAKRPPDRLEDPNEEALRQVLYGPDAPVLPPRGLITELDVHLYFDDPNRVALVKLQTELEQWLISQEPAAHQALIVADRSAPITPVVFRRGDPFRPGETVPRQFLSILAGPGRRPFQHGSGRLELGQAIVHPDNPLTARVMVNRIWAHHFGAGLVRTLSDFGTRCDPPSHPELLDWLAVRFMADGWSVKALHRLIMLSRVYQQAASGPSSEAVPADQADPENRLLHRFNRQRLDFEALRDSFLAATGELNPRMGGVAEDLGEKPFRKRRAIYGRVDRKFLPSMVRAFDFANPDVHAPERHVTAAPQQALFLMNDPFVVERCRVLVKNLNRSEERDVSARVRWLYAAVLQQSPTPSQLAQAQEFLRESFQESPPSAPGSEPSSKEALLSPWEQLAQVLFFSNGFLFID